jgi:hypothetical protein
MTSDMIFFGLDFSGARDAGRKIWLAALEHDAARSRPRVLSLVRAAELPGGGVSREDALAALRAFVISQTSAVFGCDFPFSLPAACIAQPDWRAFARAFAVQYTSPADLIAAGKQSGRELRRLTDRRTATPLAPTNLRLASQTFYGIRDLLAPLAAAGQAQILPLTAPARGTSTRPVLIEVCPASLLKANHQYFPYKGRGEHPRAARARLLAWLASARIDIPEASHALALADCEGDALDAILAAVAAWLADIARPLPDAETDWRIEGWVYGALPLLPRPFAPGWPAR